MPDITIVIPTLNEAKSIRKTVAAAALVLESSHIDGRFRIVDDNSTDGTITILEDLRTIYPLDYIIRKENHGMSQSLVEGFGYSTADIIMVMDADGQHPPERIPELYKTIKNGADIAIASRYTLGGSVWYFPWHRRLMSWGATYLARFFFPNITDSGSNFFAFRKEVIKDAPLQPQGFRMLFEILGKGNWVIAKEIPYVLRTRDAGASKLKASTVFAYIKQLWNLFTYSLTNIESHGHAEISRLVKFAIVGATGILVNLGMLYGLVENYNVNYVWASVIGAEMSILSNFCLNESITFADIESKISFWKRLGLYHVVSVGGMIITIVTTIALKEGLDVWYLWASAIGIMLAFAWNFGVNRGVTWGRK